MEYTNEFLARVYGAYYGSECVQCVGSKQELKGTISQLANLPFYERNNTKLLLTPLSQISDEDAIEVAKIAGITEIAGGVIRGNGVIVIHSPSGRKLSVYHNAGSKHVSIRIKDKGYDVIDGAQNIYDFLRSRGYDCGFSEIPSLIEAGIAIDKTTF